MNLSPQKLIDYCSLIFQKIGVPQEHSFIMAEALVEADLLGIKTHGVSRLNFYVEHIHNGTINSTPNFKVIRENLAVCVIDADKAMGPVVGDYAIKKVLEKAKKTGVGIALVRNSSHLGALSVTAKKAIKEKMIGVVISNTSPIMAPYGGGEAVLGNNPISFAVPTDDFPYILDMALSVTARGNIILAAREGKSIPEGWAVNKNGEPTTNAEEALLGAVLPLAEHKGYALAFMFDVLCGVLSGAAYGKNVGSFVPPDYSKPLDMGHFVMALDIEKFQPYEEYLRRLKDFASQIKTSKKAKGFDEIFIPGERSYQRYCENLKKGIFLPPQTLKMLRELSERYQIPFFEQ
ncbi:Ldh family oxidoreductase [Calderihabitans maritimus]|uniref:Malate dehydrogenase n=1 Tax=Calderihabitans maritimus TaxID=1246530 RepID=A0A1Z5HWL1_9FIRM|nr:Ldh family oxidoreductase [Calderihabitans maritimus]GAW93916.1 malate dehydrogenase [Calderihabitans maritimus]